jgi:hypothetical protein
MLVPLSTIMGGILFSLSVQKVKVTLGAGAGVWQPHSQPKTSHVSQSQMSSSPLQPLKTSPNAIVIAIINKIVIIKVFLFIIALNLLQNDCVVGKCVN